jgi:murein L,D-transpeptidase YafK
LKSIICLALLLFSFQITTKAQKKGSTTKKATAKKTTTAKKKATPKPKVVSNDDTETVSSDSTIKNPYYIIIDKSDYELHVYDDTGWLATYPVVFGSKDLSDKMYEGDKRTPDGEFTVTLKKNSTKWGLELLLDYPTAESVKRYNDRKAKGQIPKGKNIGNGIAIHGTRPGSEWTVDNYINWTDGCISVKYTEMKELYELIPDGTKVTIRQ